VNAELKDWTSTGRVSVHGPYDNICAIIIKLRSGDGAVRFFIEDMDLGDRQTGPKAADKVVMIFLFPKQTCWVISNPTVRFIRCIE
jgi:hypothetical protein